MSKDDERDKVRARGQEFSPEQEALEDARDAFHDDPSPENRQAFKDAQKAVAAARVAERQAREAAGPPVGAANVVRDADGKAVGWNEGPDAVTAPGGVA